MGLIGAAIGWITNVLAIRLLFRPYKPVRIPLINWQIQGLIPKRQKDIATAIGDVVSCELITGQDVVASLAREEVKDKVLQRVQELVQERVMNKLPFLLPQTLQETVAEYMGRVLTHEVAKVLENPEKSLSIDDIENIKSEIRNIVENKILEFEMLRLEEIVRTLARAELKHIELLGGILGFFIGVLQGLITIKIYL
jgi:uncharacterized membrane protein YheB (UPF0754 family)